MKAAVWDKIGHVSIMEKPKPVADEGHVVVKVKAVGVCATDIHMITGKVELATPPHVLGHEIAGEIAEKFCGDLIPGDGLHLIFQIHTHGIGGVGEGQPCFQDGTVLRMIAIVRGLHRQCQLLAVIASWRLQIKSGIAAAPGRGYNRTHQDPGSDPGSFMTYKEQTDGSRKTEESYRQKPEIQQQIPKNGANAAETQGEIHQLSHSRTPFVYLSVRSFISQAWRQRSCQPVPAHRPASVRPCRRPLRSPACRRRCRRKRYRQSSPGRRP